MNSLAQFLRKTATFVVIAALALASACKGPQGDVGPAGTPGEQGPQGSAGPQGQPGNADVRQLSFGSKTIPAGNSVALDLPLPGVDRTLLEKSAVLVYGRYSTLSGGTIWYQIPGYVGGLYTKITLNVRFIQGTPMVLEIFPDNFQNATAFTLDAIRVLIIPATTLNNGRQAAIDFDDYAAVKKAYNLPD